MATGPIPLHTGHPLSSTIYGRYVAYARFDLVVVLDWMAACVQVFQVLLGVVGGPLELFVIYHPPIQQSIQELLAIWSVVSTF